ncbi:hypothetical protein [Luteococcus sp. OSA5]|uniref:hypothetical protein n=1 Tax=Luteococcus sp. OSA5 TaxID=3401630 RepID=UPI003B427B61
MRLLGGPDSPPTGRAVADLTAAAVASAVTWASLGMGSLPLILGLGRLARGHLVA